MRVVKGGSRSRFTKNKMVLSQFMENKDIMKITVHGELNIYFSFHGKQFAKSRFTATMKITIHEENNSHFTFHGEKKGPITSHENTLYHPLLWEIHKIFFFFGRWGGGGNFADK